MRINWWFLRIFTISAPIRLHLWIHLGLTVGTSQFPRCRLGMVTELKVGWKAEKLAGKCKCWWERHLSEWICIDQRDIFQHARWNDQMVAVIAKNLITVEMEHIRTHNDGKLVIKDVCYTSRIGCFPAPTPKKHKEPCSSSSWRVQLSFQQGIQSTLLD